MFSKCAICGDRNAGVVHLNIYVFGSEGIYLCATCRSTIGGIIRELIADGRRRKLMRKMAEDKALPA